MSNDPHLKCGILAVVGAANVGKSTTINCLLEEKVSITSAVPQTTRNVIRGILNEPRGQLVFLDTPGVHKAKTELNKLMNSMARKAVEGNDGVMFIMDRSRPPKQEDDGWMRKIMGFDIPAVFILNKSDEKTSFAKEYKDLWLTILEEKSTRPKITPVWLETSAQTGDNMTALLDQLFMIVPSGPPLFDENILTDFPKNWTISDAVREKFFNVLRQELPHSLAVEVQSVQEDEKGAWHIEADVLVERHAQKGIVMGKKGRMLKHISREAELDLETMYGRRIKLNLWVKVEPHWQRNHWILKRLGYKN